LEVAEVRVAAAVVAVDDVADVVVLRMRAGLSAEHARVAIASEDSGDGYT